MSFSRAVCLLSKLVVKSSVYVCNIFRTAIIISEAKKLWPGNEKIYFKTSERKKLQLEELCTKLAQYCAIPEIGFGYGECRLLLVTGQLRGLLRLTFVMTKMKLKGESNKVKKFEFLRKK